MHWGLDILWISDSIESNYEISGNFMSLLNLFLELIGNIGDSLVKYKLRKFNDGKLNAEKYSEISTDYKIKLQY